MTKITQRRVIQGKRKANRAVIMPANLVICASRKGHSSLPTNVAYFLLTGQVEI